VPGATRPFFIPVVHSLLWAMGYVAAPKLSSRGGEAQDTWQRAHLGREARSGAEEHVAAPELSSREAEPGAMGHMAEPEPTSAGRQGPELRNMWRHRSSTQQGDEARGHKPCGSTGAHLSKEVRSGAAGHMVAPEPTSAGRCGPKLQLAWQRVDAHSAPCLRACMRGYPVFRVPIEALGPTSGDAVNSQVEPIFRRRARLSYNFTRQSTARPSSI
jgi:hypothetical protein